MLDQFYRQLELAFAEFKKVECVIQLQFFASASNNNQNHLETSLNT